MSEHNDVASEEPMLFGMPLSKFPKAPPPEDREPTLWEFLKLGWWSDVPVWPSVPSTKRGRAHG
jgi:hypothetical protein